MSLVAAVAGLIIAYCHINSDLAHAISTILVWGGLAGAAWFRSRASQRAALAQNAVTALPVPAGTTADQTLRRRVLLGLGSRLE
jgi:hypothetical protein